MYIQVCPHHVLTVSTTKFGMFMRYQLTGGGDVGIGMIDYILQKTWTKSEIWGKLDLMIWQLCSLLQHVFFISVLCEVKGTKRQKERCNIKCSLH